MTVLVEICIVITTIAIVILTSTLIYVLRRLEHVSRPLLHSIETTNGHIESLALDTRELVHRIRSMTEPVEDLWERVHEVVGRLERLTTSVVDEIEEPVKTSVALIRGLRAGTGRLMTLLMDRMTGSNHSNSGAEHHDRSHG